MTRRLLLPVLLLAAVHAFVLPKQAPFLPTTTTHSPGGRSSSSSRTTPLYMIDNFFRLHEKNRQLSWDDYFGKARYDHPHAFGAAAQSLSAADSPEAAVDAALQQALQQLPACASLDLAIVAIHSSDAAQIDAILTHLAQVLPGATRVVGWAGASLGEAVAPSLDGLGATVVGGGSTPIVSITLASIPSVSGRGFFVTEDELRAWKAQGATEASSSRVPVLQEDDDSEAVGGEAMGNYLGPDKKWEHRVGVTLNEAYKDPPVFLLLGNLHDMSLAHVAMQGLDCTYPGTARIGGFSPDTLLFSREGGSQGGRILREQDPGLLGLALVGDIRALTYVNQGAEVAADGGVFRIEAVSEDGKTITRVTTSDGQSKTPAEAGLPTQAAADGSLALGLGNDDPLSSNNEKDSTSTSTSTSSTSREGADRWSLVSVRGGKQAAAVLKEGWTITADGSLQFADRQVSAGQYLSVYKQNAALALEQETKLVADLRKEIEQEWSKAELGVMKFRPTGVLLTKDPAYPGDGLQGAFGQALSAALPTAPLAGLGIGGGQLAPLNPAMKTSALYKAALVVNVLACKAKRRDLREIRFAEHFRTATTEPSPLDLPFDPDQPLMEPKTGEVAVNRQAALIGTDVRVDNMAWNVREESVFPTSLFECMVWTKERELYFVREEAPLMNLMRTVMMMIKNPDPVVQAKAKGLDVFDVLNAQAEGDKKWAVLGDVSRGTPFDGIAAPLYDAVQAAEATRTASGAGALAMRVDQTYYGGKYQHVRDVKDALREAKVPVVADDLVLYPYQLYLAKLFGADGVKMGQLSVLSDEDLRYQVKICQTLSLTPIISVASLPQLRRAAALPLNQTSVLTIDDRDWSTMRTNSGPKHKAMEWLQDPEVQAHLKARREGAGAGGAPLILVEGRSGLIEADKEELRGLGVKGEVYAFADLPVEARIAAGKPKAGTAAAGVAAEAGKGVGDMKSFKEMLKASYASSAGP